uniref:phosphatidylinositol-3,4,5-trisphosphate 3-phosphatase n=1 Tax=Acrobeloides nanus TaxID=290746 RepID=A0A914C1Y8_9BILA
MNENCPSASRVWPSSNTTKAEATECLSIGEDRHLTSGTDEECFSEGLGDSPNDFLVEKLITPKSVDSAKLSYDLEKPHHGSTSTTFSNGSILSSCTGETAEDGSTCSSSGVATMSSNDQLPYSTTTSSITSTITPHSNGSVSTPSTVIDQATGAKINSNQTLNGEFPSSDFPLASSAPSCSTMTGPSPNGRRAPSGSVTLEPPLINTQRRNNSKDSNANSDSGSATHCINGSSSPSASSSTSPIPQQTQPPFNCGTSPSQLICTPLRMIVSQNRRRYQQDGFNLDLTYITDRIIAMGYPADTTEALYRNSMSHIVKFLEHYHPGHYKVFNLRGQYVYDTSKFHNRVVSFEMTDHHPPRLELMAPFCREVHDYLQADPKNVVAVHCKAGKGRTGVMICAYLVYINFYMSPRQNMDYYSIVRTHNNKGVTIPSQRRYVYYFAHLRNKKLNYMPLKTELVGIYVEKPPSVSNPFCKGALKVRVANGDVDVFVGEDLWLSSEKSDEDEELCKKYPVLTGEDQYDPYNPQPGKDCISRRCYGWTVPSNKRVFLEGDVRVDIFSKSQLKVIGVNQDKKKIGHIWFNTMFTCPGFCGGTYVHGDEAYPYPDEGTTIVKRTFKRKINTTCQKSVEKSIEARLQKVTASSVPSSPPVFKGHSKSMAEPSTSSGSQEASEPVPPTRVGAKTPSFMHRKSSKNAMKLNGVMKKITDVASSTRCSEKLTEQRWASQDGIIRARNASKNRASLDIDSEFEEELIVEKPAGLDAHCPEHTLKELYPAEKSAPRYGIDDMLREAHRKNLITDLYNARRMSVPVDGNVIPKAPVGRPNADGPFCLMRKPDEHVTAYSVLEIDRAHKNKDMDLGFKVYVVTRCIDEADNKLAEHFLKLTYQKQMEKDCQKFEKVQNRQKKLAHQTSTNIEKDRDSSVSGVYYNESPTQSSAMLCSQGGSSTALNEEAEKSFHDDPRIKDPHLRKFFFRQRISSLSKHPNVHYHCPLQPLNPTVCAKHKCKGNIEPTSSNNFSSSLTDRPYFGEDEFDEFAHFDTINDSGDEDRLNPGDLTASTTLTALQSRSATMIAVDQKENEQLKQEKRSKSARIPAEKCMKKESVASFVSSTVSDLAGSEDFHPSDCGWVSSSSTSSSCRSISEDMPPPASPETPPSETEDSRDNVTLRRPT